MQQKDGTTVLEFIKKLFVYIFQMWTCLTFRQRIWLHPMEWSVFWIIYFRRSKHVQHTKLKNNDCHISSLQGKNFNINAVDFLGNTPLEVQPLIFP